MRLPNPGLKEISVDALAKIRECVDQVGRIGQGITNLDPSDIEELEKRSNRYANREITIEQVLDSARMGKTYLFCYGKKGSAERVIDFDEEVLETIWKLLSKRPGPLLSLYFKEYLALPAWKSLAEKLYTHYSTLNTDQCPSFDAGIKEHAFRIFPQDAPMRLAKYANRQGLDIESLERLIKIPSYGNFHDDTVKSYYISHVETLEPGEVSSLLREAATPQVSGLTLDDRRVGHVLIAKLCEQCIASELPLPELWTKIILGIASDPRSNPTTKSYQTWWAIQTAQVRDLVKAAMAKRDLKFFLQYLDDFATRNGGEIERMFRTRMTFLSGILEEGLVDDALLILSPDASSFMKNSLTPNERRNFLYASHAGGQKHQCQIYVKLKNGHFIEGTHNSYFRIYSESSTFANHLLIERPKRINYSEITNSDFSDAIRHHPELTWQHSVMEALYTELSVKLDPQKVLGRREYTEFIQTKTLSY